MVLLLLRWHRGESQVLLTAGEREVDRELLERSKELPSREKDLCLAREAPGKLTEQMARPKYHVQLASLLSPAVNDANEPCAGG